MEFVLLLPACDPAPAPPAPPPLAHPLVELPSHGRSGDPLPTWETCAPWPLEWPVPLDPFDLDGDGVSERKAIHPEVPPEEGVPLLAVFQACPAPAGEGPARWKVVFAEHGEDARLRPAPPPGTTADLVVTIPRTGSLVEGGESVPFGPVEAVFRVDPAAGGAWLRTGEATFRAPGCPPGQHEAGGGYCQAAGTCAGPFTLTPDGRCDGVLPLPGTLGLDPVGLARFGLNGAVAVGLQAGKPRAAMLLREEGGWQPVDLPPGKGLRLVTALRTDRGAETFVLDASSGGGAHLDPATRRFVDQPARTVRRQGASALALPSPARLVVAGGDGCSGDAPVAEVLTLAGGGWTRTAPMRHARRQPTLLPLAGGRVLAVGGKTCGADAHPVLGLETWDPSTSAWSDAGSLPPDTTAVPFAAPLPDGRVLVVRQTGAGLDSGTWVDPGTPWTPVPAGDPLPVEASVFTALPDGAVLAVACPVEGACQGYRFDPHASAWRPSLTLDPACRPTDALALGPGVALLAPCPLPGSGTDTAIWLVGR